MIQLKPLPSPYQIDLEEEQGKRYFKSMASRLYRTTYSRIKQWHPTKKKQNDQKFSSEFQDLIKLNESKSQYKLFTYYKRGRSTENYNEGFLNKKVQQAFISLPFACVQHLKRSQIRRKWQQIINAVRAVLRYKQARYETIIKYRKLFYIYRRNLAKRLLIPLSPKTTSKSMSQKRAKHVNNQFKGETFGDYIDTLEAEREQKCKQQRRQPNYKLSIYFKDIRQDNKSRILKLSCIRSQSVQIPKLKTPDMNSQAMLSRIESTTKRTTSVLIRRIKQLR